jgi:hypothetical protein
MARGVVVLAGLVLAPLLGAFGASTAAAAPPSVAPLADHPPTAAIATGTQPAAARSLVSATPCGVTAKACMDLSRHQAWLTDGAGHVIAGPVAARGGTKSAPTPVGTFHVLSKDKNFYSTEFHAPMPYSVFFYPGDAFHADSTSVASNGCIHLTSSSAQRFYNTLHLGDPVQIVG